MSDKITVIGDKDVGHVFGAVRQLGAGDALSVEQVVDGAGLLLRANGPAAVLSLPQAHLKTWAVTNEAALTEPRTFAVVNGVLQALDTAHVFTNVDIRTTGIEFNALTTDAKVKAILRRKSDDKTVVVDVQSLKLGAVKLTASLNAGTYDLLLLAEGYMPYLKANKATI